MSPRDMDRYKVYDAEELAFKGTPLGDHLSEREVTAALTEIRDSDWWAWGHFSIKPARVDWMEAQASASLFGVKVGAGGADRSTISHELAHILVKRLGHWDVAGHGEEFRGAHIYTVGAIFGSHYGSLLLRTYEDYGLRTPGLTITGSYFPATPVIPIDAYTLAAAPTGGWRRS